jgi:hypothetical protein
MITRLARLRYLRVAGLAAAAVAVGGAAVVVTASAGGMSFGLRGPAAPQSAVDASTTSAACSTFMQHFATDLGKSQSEINAAFQKAVAETLADEVKSGKITQSQADAIKKKLANATPCTLPSTAPRPGGEKAIAAFMEQYLAASASALGISETELKTDLKSGQSLSQIAAARHVTEATFRTKVIANLKPVLDKAVTDKKITSAQEQEILSRLQTGELPLWNKPEKRPQPAATPSPKTTTT